MNFIKNTFIVFGILLFSFTASFSQENLSLGKAIGTALEQNYNIKIINNNVKIAKLNNDWAMTGATPQINLEGLGNYTGSFADGNSQQTTTTSLGLGLNWLLFDGMGMQIRKIQLEYLEDLSKGNSVVVVETTIQNVISLYYNALLQKEMFDMYKYIRDLSKDRFDYEQQKKDAGVSVTYTVLQAQNAYLTDETNYLNQRAMYHDALRNLNYSMGIPAETSFNLTEEFNIDPMNYDYNTLLDKMIASNSNLKNQYINQKILESNIRAARASRGPSLSFSGSGSGGYTGNKANDMDFTNALGVRASAGLVLQYSLFDFGKTKISTQVAEVNEEIGRLEMKDMKYSLSIQLSSLFEFYNVRKEVLKVSDEALKAAKLNLEISEEKFKNGSINSFNYRDIQQMYLSTAITQLNAIFNVIDSKVQILRLTGGIISEYE